MLHKTSGIILHTTKYSESQLIAKIYTQQFGLQSYIISGVHSKKSKTKATLFQPLSIVDLEVTHSAKGGLERISEINNAHPYASIPYNINKSSIVLFLNEILYKSINEAHPDDDLFEFVKNSLLILDVKTESCSNFHVFFMLQLSRFLGFYPQGNFSSQNSYFDLKEGSFIATIPIHPHYIDNHQSELLNSFINDAYSTIHLIRLDNTQRKHLLQSLILYYQFHISSFKEIKSLSVLEEVIA